MTAGWGSILLRMLGGMEAIPYRDGMEMVKKV